MQDHPNPGAPSGAFSPTDLERRVQRWVLLELVTAPPPDGDEIAKLALGLKELEADVAAAVDALVAVGLAERDGDRVRGTAAALRFDEPQASRDRSDPRRGRWRSRRNEPSVDDRYDAPKVTHACRPVPPRRFGWRRRDRRPSQPALGSGQVPSGRRGRRGP